MRARNGAAPSVKGEEVILDDISVGQERDSLLMCHLRLARRGKFTRFLTIVQDNQTPLLAAILAGRVDIVKYLVEDCGVDLYTVFAVCSPGAIQWFG